MARRSRHSIWLSQRCHSCRRKRRRFTRIEVPPRYTDLTSGGFRLFPHLVRRSSEMKYRADALLSAVIGHLHIGVPDCRDPVPQR